MRLYLIRACVSPPPGLPIAVSSMDGISIGAAVVGLRQQILEAIVNSLHMIAKA